MMIKSQKKCLYVFLMLVAVTQLTAQPGSCSFTFNPLRTCQDPFVTEEFVFVGQVSSINSENSGTTKVGRNDFGKIYVNEVIPIKGKLAKATKLFLDQTVCQGHVEVGKKYIFTAHKVKVLGFTEIVSFKWSTTIEDISKDNLTEIIKNIRSVTKNIKQPSVTGRVVQYNLDPLGIYDFQGESLTSKLGYNPKFASPLHGIKIFAKNKNGEVVETITDETGKFEFGNLASGNYEISPLIAKKTVINSFQYFTSRFEDGFRSITTEKKFFYIRNMICGEDIRFNTRILDDNATAPKK
jgi:hypothetical protein